jgi:hypothetical protein
MNSAHLTVVEYDAQRREAMRFVMRSRGAGACDRRAVDACGVPIIEVSHGDDLGGSRLYLGFSKEDPLE